MNQFIFFLQYNIQFDSLMVTVLVRSFQTFVARILSKFKIEADVWRLLWLRTVY